MTQYGISLTATGVSPEMIRDFTYLSTGERFGHSEDVMKTTIQNHKNQRKNQNLPLSAILALLLATATSGARAGLLAGPAPTRDFVLADVTLLEGTRYRAEVDVAITDVPDLLALLSGNDSPIQLLDGSGTVLGELTSDGLVRRLLDRLIGAPGTLDVTDSFGTVVGTVPVDGLVRLVLGDGGTLPVLDGAGGVLGVAQSGGLIDDLLGGLLGGVLGGGGTIDLFDGGGALIGELPLQDLIDLLDGLVTPVTMALEFVTDEIGGTVVGPVLRIVDTPLVQVGTTQVTVVQPTPVVNQTTIENRSPQIRITKRKVRNGKLILKGTATDPDGAIRRVQALHNGDRMRVKGKATWRVKVRLDEGRNKIVIRAFDRDQGVSRPKRVRLRGR